MLTHIIKCAALTWLGAVTLGLLYGAAMVHRSSPHDLWVMGLVQVSFIISSVVAILITPLTAWALYGRTGAIKWLVILWTGLAVFCLLVAPINALLTLYGAIAIGTFGLICIRRFAKT